MSVKATAIPLTLGVDQSAPLGKAAPGSLRDCLNVEIVDGHLEVSKGNFRLGDQKLNEVGDIYILAGDNSGYFDSGVITPGEEVYWYAGSTLGTPLGKGVWYEHDTVGAEFVAITGVRGLAPTVGSGMLYFVGQSSGAVLTPTDPEIVFALPHRKNSYITAAMYKTAIEKLYDYPTLFGYTWDAMRPSPFRVDDYRNAGVSHVFGLNDDVYAISDFMVMGFQNGEARPQIGNRLTFDYGGATPHTLKLARVELTTGSFENDDAGGWLYLYPYDGGTTDTELGDELRALSNDVIFNEDAGVTMGYTITDAAGTTPVHKYHGQLYYLDTATNVNTGWKWVHPGYSVPFHNLDTSVDQTAPATRISPLFVSDAEKTITDTGWLSFNTPTEMSATAGTAWSNLANLAADDGGYATNTMTGANSYARRLNFTVPAGNELPGDATITGIEVSFEAKCDTANSVCLSEVRLIDDYAPTASHKGTYWMESENRARGKNEYIDTSDTVYTFGGQLDLWGMKEIQQSHWDFEDIQLELEFYDTTAGNSILSVDYVFIKVHYTRNTEKVYFWDGTSDVTTGEILAYQVMDGDWSTDNAEGWLSFKSIAAPGQLEVTGGLEIRTAASGGGSFIGNTKGVYMNNWPSLAEMREAGTRSRVITSAMASEDGDETAYGVNGVGPCFAVDVNRNVRFIRTPVSPHKDKPRFVEEHRNHLMLALEEHFLVSSIGTPDNFSTFDGATTWSVKDRVSGLHHTTDGTTVVLCTNSIYQFQGAAASGSEPFAMTTITSKGGARPYSSIEMGDIYFLSNVGLTSVSATDKFGNFDSAAYSRGIEEWLRHRLNHARNDYNTNTSAGDEDPSPPLTLPANDAFLDSMPCKSKNQLRYYFNDGYILTATIDASGETPPQFTFQNPTLAWGSPSAAEGDHPGNEVLTVNPYYAPTCLQNYTTSWGEERMYIGVPSAYGDVYLLEQGSFTMKGGLSSAAPSQLIAYAELNPIAAGVPYDEPSQSTGCGVVFDAPKMSDLYVYTATDFERPNVRGTASSDAQYNPYKIADESDDTAYSGDRKLFVANSFISNVGLAHAWTILTKQEYAWHNTPLRFIQIMPRLMPRLAGARREAAQFLGTTIPYKD